jgi:uncharacterized membrane protein YccC
MDLSAFPRRVLLRWELVLRVALALLVPLGVGFALNGDLSWVLASLVAALVSLSCLGPDVRSMTWSAIAAVGSVATMVLGLLLSDQPLPLQFLLIFLLFAGLGAGMLAGLISQLAFTPIAFLGMIAMVLAGDDVDGAVILLVAGGAAWALLLIAVVPLWQGWPRLPIPAEKLRPDTDLLHRMVTAPRWQQWGFPVLLGALAALVLYAADFLNDGTRPYWAVLGLVGALGPTASKTRDDSKQTVIGTAIGVVSALLLFQLPLADGALLLAAVGLGLIGVLITLTNGMLSKAMTTVLVIVLIAVLTGDDPGDVAGLRLVDYLVGAAIAMLAAGLAEFLAQRLEEDRPVEQAEIAG